jgi:uncharacterized protein YdaU (DUF1376 family)
VNYYERHLGDYARDTGHLTMLEHGAYGLLLDRYYATEQGLPADDVLRLARARTKEERAAVNRVLKEFFVLREGVWVHEKCDKLIVLARVKIDAARVNGKKGGRPKKPKGSEAETQEKPSGFSVGSENETQAKAHQAPYTNHQLEQEQKHVAPTGTTADRFADFWAAYPDKTGKKPARDKWTAKRLDRRADEIIADVERRKREHGKWLDGFVPNPATYLSQERWNDPVVPRAGPRAPPPQQIGKTMGAILALEEMKRGLAEDGNCDGSATLALPGT